MDPTVENLTTVAGLAGVTFVVVEIVLRAWAPSAATKDRFGPLLAVLIAVALGEIATAVLQISGDGLAPIELLQAFITGLVAGSSSMGIHDLVDSAAPKATA